METIDYRLGIAEEKAKWEVCPLCVLTVGKRMRVTLHANAMVEP